MKSSALSIRSRVHPHPWAFPSMEHLCHAMEDVFSLVRSGAADISPELGNLLLACSDLIEQMLDEIESGGDSSSRLTRRNWSVP